MINREATPRMPAPPNPPGPLQFKFRPSRQPMLWAALAYSRGIGAGTYIWRPAPRLVVATTALIAAAAYFLPRRVWLAATLALSSLFLVGTLHIQVARPSSMTDTSI